MQSLPAADLARFFDYTLLRPDATEADLLRLCEQARAWGVKAVSIQLYWVPLAVRALDGSGVAVGSLCGFPLGGSTVEMKTREALEAIDLGAIEIDAVMNVGAFLSGHRDYVKRELEHLVEACRSRRRDVVIKVILEAGCLSDGQKVEAAQLVTGSGADFVKTSTGFGPGGAAPEDVALLRQAVPDHVGVKAAGSIRTESDARALLAAGATRLGSSQVGHVLGVRRL